MPRFSEHFGLHRTQPELDFVDVRIDEDLELFVDPFAISQRIDPLSQDAHETLLDFFGRVVEAIRSGHDGEARGLLLNLREPNETRLGMSAGQPRGAGVGRDQSELLFQALKDSGAVRTGVLRHLEECELIIPGVGRDKISDITTNVVRRHLVDYTLDQCALWGVPTCSAPLPPSYLREQGRWVSDYHDLPITPDGPVLLVPKVWVRHTPLYQPRRYYRDIAIEYLRAEHLSASSSLVQTLRNGSRTVYIKDLEAEYPFTKEFLYRFTMEHPEALTEFRERLASIDLGDAGVSIDPEDESLLAHALATALDSIPPGPEHASEYHRAMLGILEFAFFPRLLNPRKEHEIHDGLKRIDIVMTNGARDGILYRLRHSMGIPASYVPIECKNYGKDVGNPELDQLSGRFSRDRGEFGILCCRSVEDRERLLARCRRTLIDGRGCVVVLDDSTVSAWLGFIARGQREAVEADLTRLVDEVASN